MPPSRSTEPSLEQLYRADTQINFYVPRHYTAWPHRPHRDQRRRQSRQLPGVNITATDPGIFPGAVVHAGTSVSADTTPVKAGDYIEGSTAPASAPRASPRTA